MKPMLAPTLFLILTIMIQVAPVVSAPGPDPVTIQSNAVSTTLRYGYEHKIFQGANGQQFYVGCNVSPSLGAIGYTTSNDGGNTWTAGVRIGNTASCNNGRVSLYSDGDYAYVANGDRNDCGGIVGQICYWPCTIGATSLTCPATYAVTMCSGTCDATVNDVGVAIDNNGNVWLTASMATSGLWVAKCTCTANGAWSTTGGFPVNYNVGGTLYAGISSLGPGMAIVNSATAGNPPNLQIVNFDGLGPAALSTGPQLAADYCFAVTTLGKYVLYAYGGATGGATSGIHTVLWDTTLSWTTRIEGTVYNPGSSTVICPSLTYDKIQNSAILFTPTITSTGASTGAAYYTSLDGSTWVGPTQITNEILSTPAAEITTQPLTYTTRTSQFFAFAYTQNPNTIRYAGTTVQLQGSGSGSGTGGGSGGGGIASGGGPIAAITNAPSNVQTILSILIALVVFILFGGALVARRRDRRPP